MPEFHFSGLDESAVTALAAELASCVHIGDVVALRGDLGAGKTTFVGAFIHALPGGEALRVTSPTFALLQTYALLDVEIWHFDLYRLEREEELYELGLEEAFQRGVTLIEWPQRAGGLLPEHLTVHMMFTQDNNGEEGGREVTVTIPERLMPRFERIKEHAAHGATNGKTSRNVSGKNAGAR